MNGTVLGREINQVAVVVVWNGYGEVSPLVDEGSGGSPEVSGINGKQRGVVVAVLFTDHKGMILRNAPSKEYVTAATLKRIGTYVYGLLLLIQEGVVWGIGVAPTYPKVVSSEVFANWDCNKGPNKEYAAKAKEPLDECFHI